MPRAHNPLLAPCKSVLGQIKYWRVYTTRYKAGGFRVKFYGLYIAGPTRMPNGADQLQYINSVRQALATAGHTDVTVDFGQGKYRPMQVTIKAGAH